MRTSAVLVAAVFSIFIFTFTNITFASCGGTCYVDSYDPDMGYFTCSDNEECQYVWGFGSCIESSICSSAPTCSESNKPSCPPTADGDTCKYGGSASCNADDTWSCSYSSSDTTQETCSNIVSGNTCTYGRTNVCGSSGWSCSSGTDDTDKPTCSNTVDSNTCKYGGTTSCGSSGWSTCSYTKDTNKPSTYYESGGTCYYSCTSSCGSSGWSRTTCSNAKIDDGNPCTVDSCTSTGVSNTDVKDEISCTSQNTPGVCKSGSCVIPTPIPVQPTCTTTQPFKTFQLDNSCWVTVASLGSDTTDSSSGRYRNTVTNGYITTEFDDAISGGCDLDLKFKNSWTKTTNSITVASEKLEKNAGHSLKYGYDFGTLSPCRIQKVDNTASSAFSSPYLTLDAGYAGATTLYPDTLSSSSFGFTIGECSTDAECVTLKGTGSTCGTNNMCTTPSTQTVTLQPPTLVSPDNGATVTTLTPTLTWNRNTANPNNADYYQWYVKNSPAESFGSAALAGRSGVTSSTSSQVSITVPSGKLSNGITYYWSASQGISSTGPWSSYASERNFKTPECLQNSDCSSRGTGWTCRLSDNTCVPPAIPVPCSFNSQCPDNKCCTADPSLGDKAVPPDSGECVDTGTLKQPYLCTK